MDDLLREWLRWDEDPVSREFVSNLARSSPAAFEKIMTPRISFGTAGLRGEMAPGFANMNAVTVRQASQGLAEYVNKATSNKVVVLGHDHRHHSIEFARIVEEAFTSKGFKVRSLGLVPTPFVPLAVSTYTAACGVMITASHNPGKDNGYKVYWSNACQIIPPHDEEISEEIANLVGPWARVSPSFNIIRGNQEVRTVYMDALKDVTFGCSETSRSSHLRVVYTPMHGTGYDVLPEALKSLPFPVDLLVVKEQIVKDPDFSTVRFPNPEEEGALDLAFEYAERNHADIVIANDPDADRFACAIRNTESGSWTRLTGDDVGTLLSNFLLLNVPLKWKEAVEESRGLAVVNSTVSSRRLARLAELYGAQYEETLTGFKWIGNKVLDLRSENLIVPFAYEEALGYMCLPQIADKDGISAAFVFVQFVQSVAGAAGIWKTIADLSSKIGHFSTYNSYYRTADLTAIGDAFENIRRMLRTGNRVGELEVVAWRDLTLGYDSSTLDHIPILPVSKSTEMVTIDARWKGRTGLRITARGSGTEPKLKVYIEAVSETSVEAQRASKFAWDVLQQNWFNDPRLTSEK